MQRYQVPGMRSGWLEDSVFLKGNTQGCWEEEVVLTCTHVITAEGFTSVK